MNDDHIIEKVQNYVEKAFASQELVWSYHNIVHTQRVVKASQKLGKKAKLPAESLEILQIAAWFHDIGYFEGQLNHEARSVNVAKSFLQQEKYPINKIEEITACIMATKMPQNPQNFLQQILCDADLSNLGSPYFREAANAIRVEMNKRDPSSKCSEKELFKHEIDFVEQHQYHTDEAKKIFGPQKEVNIAKLKKELEMELQEDKNQMVPLKTDSKKEEKKQKEKEKKKEKKKTQELELAQLKKQIKKELKAERKKDEYGRGVETFFRVALRNHIALSSIADSKASTLLSVNAIIISVIFSVFVPRIQEFNQLIIPVIVIMITCLVTIIFAVFSTSPKVTHGVTDRQTIIDKKSNLAFFGNFHQMPLDDFIWGTKEMFKDSEFLYDSLSRDLYFLGVVLEKKYRYLRIAYRIFVGGLILSVILFTILAIARAEHLL